MTTGDAAPESEPSAARAAARPGSPAERVVGTPNDDAPAGEGGDASLPDEQPGDIPFEQAAAEHENPALG